MSELAKQRLKQLDILRKEAEFKGEKDATFDSPTLKDKIVRLWRRGVSLRQIEQKLQKKGLSKETAREVIGIKQPVQDAQRTTAIVDELQKLRDVTKQKLQQFDVLRKEAETPIATQKENAQLDLKNRIVRLWRRGVSMQRIDDNLQRKGLPKEITKKAFGITTQQSSEGNSLIERYGKQRDETQQKLDRLEKLREETVTDISCPEPESLLEARDKFMHEQAVQKVAQRLYNFIVASLEHGMSKRKIKKALIKRGWKEDIVQQYVEQIAQELSTPKQQRTKLYDSLREYVERLKETKRKLRELDKTIAASK